MVEINKNFHNLEKSTTLAINEKSNELLSQGREVYKFGLGQSPFPVPESVAEELQKKAHEKDYLAVAGLEDLRIEIAKYHSDKNKHNYSSSDIIVGPGSKELLFQIQFVLDYELILPTPSWVSYLPQAILMNKNFHFVKSNASINWDLNTQELDELCQKNKKAKLLIINSPNNPSGTTFSNLNEIVEVAKKNNLIIISDEIYCELDYEGKYKSITHLYPERTIINSGLSKWCGAGGWRLGFLAVPKKLTEFLKSLKSLASESYSTVNTPTQYASVEAYANEHDQYKLKVRAILNAVGNYVYNNLKSNKVLIAPPQGAFYLMPEFKNKKYKTSSKLCEAILNETGVAMLPGSDFGFKPSKMLTRLSYTDFDGTEFFRNVTNCKMIDDEMIKKYAPNVVEGVSKLSNWVKNL